ncbi:TonB-dependent receptor [Pseudoalteromonas peptidolytica]|uniref:Iron complex outermembrane recepter protein n=1 Tax=Pseudoalteromonas peptidolytica F12-50-A1 TaxID=1315280 RepID=A0A8I0MVM3_9GAMM|nr:TonB-dependent receptor [Pseudoalteromonas peptidolytica]MBE0346228.1 iron complex outermembrane recepter protein [Pseudoalteromonas peptidolytica F12-50-A1]NLR14144.1 TonB-dependent receptor [Pseudoalteromonas peptidolytica]GEK09445.1 TonB-dependent receptor [Pseudoalteromonas peptidolytica]
MPHSNVLMNTVTLALLFAISSEASAKAENIEIIEVYAQKRKQSINDVAIAVKPIFGSLIKDAAVKDTTELGSLVSNVKISQNAAEGTPPAINIRGVGLVDYNTANTSPIGLYLDGISVGSANNQIINLFDMEQIEVLKGPQGTLFGRNTTGGAILLRTKRPEDGDYAYLTAGIGSDSLSSASTVINLSLTNDSAMRFAGSHKKYDYTTYNLDDRFPEAGMEQNDARLSYFGEFDDFSLFIKADYGHWNGLVQPVGNIGIYANPADGTRCAYSQLGSSNCVDLFGFNSGSDDFWAVRVNNYQQHHSVSKGLTGELTYQLAEQSQLVYLSAFNRLDRIHGFNCDGSIFSLCEGELGLKTEKLTNELRYEQGSSRGFLTLGLFQLEERIYQDNYNDLLRDLRGTENGSSAATFYYDNDIEISSHAIFGQYEYRLSEETALLLGLRYSDEKVDYDTFSYMNIPFGDNTAGILIPSYDIQGETSDTNLSGKFSVIHKLESTKSLYYSLANGVKSGGYNGGFLVSRSAALRASYGPEKLIAHELGAKLMFEPIDLRTNFAAFYYDYKDQQVFMNQASEIPGAPPYQLLKNVGKSTIYGVELENTWGVSKQTQVSLDVGYIPEANFEEFVDPLGVALTDNRLPFTSKWNIAGHAEHKFSWNSVGVKARVGFDYQSEYYFDQNESLYASQPSYILWNANLQFKYDKWQVGVWGKNLLDKEYSHLIFDLSSFIGMLEDFKGEGRRIGLDVTYHF